MADRTVGGLYLSLGLDISELEHGFALADRTVNQAVKRFDSEATQIKLKADIDMANADSAIDKLTIRYKSLGEQIELARKKELLLKRDMEAAAKNFGADNAVTTRATTALLKQQKTVALLAAEQRKLKTAMDASASSVFSFGNALSAAQGGMGGLMASLGSAGPAAAALAAALGTVAGLASLTKEAADAAAAIGDLGDKFGMVKEEAAQLMGTTKAAGVDTEGFVSWLTRLDKTVTSAGEAGNETTRTLSRFGVSLTDGTGKLLTYNQQLARLAEGYKNAQAVGKTEEFLSGLGRGGAQFADMFNKMEEYSRRGGTMYGKTILDAVAPAQELTDRLAELDEQLDSLRLAFGAVFVPVATELIPPIVEKLQDLKDWIDQNSNALEAFAGAAANAVGKGLKTNFATLLSLGEVPEAYHRLFDSAEEAAARREAEAQREAARAAQASATPTKEQRAAEQQKREAKAAADAELKAQKENAEAITEIWRKATASKLENDLAAIDTRMKKELEAANLTAEARGRIEQRYAAEKAATLYKANQQMEEMNRELSDSIAKQTKGELENALRDIDRQADATRKRYKDLFGQVSAETENLIQQNAELQRQNALQSRADKALTSEKKYWDIFQQAMNGGMVSETFKNGLKMYTMTGNLSREERLQVAEDAIRKAMLKERGIDSANVRTSDLLPFDAIMKKLQGGGLANIVDDAGVIGDKVGMAVQTALSETNAQMADGMNTRLAPALEQMQANSANYQSAALGQYEAIRQAVDSLAAKLSDKEAVAPVITVQIDSAVTEDSASMTRLADTVADRINEVLVRYIGDGGSSGRNTY